MDVQVREVDEVTAELVDAIGRLLPQLAPNAAHVDGDALAQIVGDDRVTLLVARAGDTDVAGMLTLLLFRVPTGLRARIEDVVVDAAARGYGVGAALTVEAVRRARSAGARTIDLTSRPSRTAANRLYERLGFSPREARVYRYTRDL